MARDTEAITRSLCFNVNEMWNHLEVWAEEFRSDLASLHFKGSLGIFCLQSTVEVQEIESEARQQATTEQ